MTLVERGDTEAEARHRAASKATARYSLGMPAFLIEPGMLKRGKEKSPAELLVQRPGSAGFVGA